MKRVSGWGPSNKVEGCAICGNDLMVLSASTVQITGHEIVGTVIEVGKGVSGFNTNPVHYGERRRVDRSMLMPNHLPALLTALAYWLRTLDTGVS